ncbi:MAG: acyl-phosphate glycerol 3-phosphate acyltransferase [Micavibrio aeruginosavorus]|uniref:Glycerol-3-phosphate acyltransferase n=1 Tax=Micavibrio aeruginosavorus TaxID=349221 RepID=A0A2W5N1V4_9BACT|nr:MAG: acyl-phosphate glycerol 3-phosphate acyltransferase [Micavibrio aeruginosavorus]
MVYAIAILGGYLLGSIPFGLVLTRLAGYGDIRNIGSGNIGATNVLRTGNKPLALATLLLDSGKGAIAVAIALYFADFNIALITGFAALVGHLFPVWLKFKGGKGVATTLGTLLALQPVIGAAVCGAWLLTAVTTRYSSLSAIVAIASAPPIAHFLYHDANLTGFCGFVALLVIMKHRANIERLIRKEEPKIGQKK